MSQIYGKIFNDSNLSETHFKIIEIAGGNKEVLELGSSTGYLTKQMNRRGCLVDIVEIDKADAQVAEKFARKTYVGSLEDLDFIEKIDRKYDVIVASNILEHLKNPFKILRLIKDKLKKDGQVLIALPNIACWAIRKDLFFKGKFDYKETGILDKTHLRFFTYFTAQDLVKESGLKILDIVPTEISYPLHFRILKLGYLGKILDRIISKQLLNRFPNLTVSHLLIVGARYE